MAGLAEGRKQNNSSDSLVSSASCTGITFKYREIIENLAMKKFCAVWVAINRHKRHSRHGSGTKIVREVCN